jgi:TolB-like protein
MHDLPRDGRSSLETALAEHYRVERELGAGGMATVYLAEDVKHHRQVAVKVLREDLTASLGKERFLREIAIAAGLSHPHILPLHDSGEAGGRLFYVMPFVDGPSLREQLRRSGELPISDAVRVLRDVADAMAHAHKRGVVHRDLKPENVMLTERHALVTDFGVAKALSEATGRQTLTTAGVALGTPAYMSPEQATADPHTDHRSDIYSFGVLAYELLTGRTPFQGGSPQEVLAAHVTAAATPVSQHRASIPPALATLVMRCLEKKPADRPQHAEELIPLLEQLLTPSGGITPHETEPYAAAAPSRTSHRRRIPLIAAAVLVVASGGAAAWRFAGRGSDVVDPRLRAPVVVLPFEVQGGDERLGALGVQAAERITAAIEGAKLGAVVRHRAEPGDEAVTDRQRRRVARETGAATLVAGSIARRGEELEVTARVIRAQDMTTIWTLGPDRATVGAPTVAMDANRERVLGAIGWYLSPESAGMVNPGIWQPPSSLAGFRLMDDANRLIRTNRPAAAIPLLRDAFALDTTWLGGAMLLTTAYGNSQRWQLRDSVMAYLRDRKARLYPGDALYLEFAETGSPEQQYAAARALLAADPSDQAHYLVMLSAVGARRPAEALRYFAMRDTSTLWGRKWQLWDDVAAQAYHTLGRFEDELSLARAAKAREPREYAHWNREVRALVALGRTGDVERLIAESFSLELAGAPTRLTYAAALELAVHAHADLAGEFARRSLDGEGRWPDSLRRTIAAVNLRRTALRILGDHRAVAAIYDEQSRTRGAGGLAFRILGMRDRILMGDTTGAMALVDSARTQPLTAFDGSDWGVVGAPRYYAAHILSLLGRKDEAVGMLRESLNGGWRLVPDEPLGWQWAPIRDHPPFRELVKVRDDSP